MRRACLQCSQPLTALDLSKKVSRKIEAERKSRGLWGFQFRCYNCPACGQANLFVDMHFLNGETDVEFRSRREELETTIRQSCLGSVQVALAEKRPDAAVPSKICF
jgi:hypothetical protein